MIHCKECSPMMINRVFCHETGCPNSKKDWDEENEEWVTPANDEDYEWEEDFFDEDEWEEDFFDEDEDEDEDEG